MTAPTPAPDAAALADEVASLRAQLSTARIETARAMARATRLSQIVSALGRDDDLDLSLRDLVGDIAELFTADVCVMLAETEEGHRVLAPWGIPEHRGLDLEATLPPNPTSASPAELETWLGALAPVAHVIVTPLNGRRRQVGLLVLGRCADPAFSSGEAQELAAVASRVALGSENSWLVQATQRHLAQVERLHAITRELTTPLTRDEFVTAMCDIVEREAPGLRPAVYVGEPNADLVLWATGAGSPAAWPETAAVGAAVHGTEGLTLAMGAPWGLHGLLAVAGRPTADDQGLLRHLAEVGTLVLERVALNERLHAQARTDALTGLANRRTVMETLDAALARADRQDRVVGLVFVDLDGFKQVNDRHGHAAGDDVLREVAARLLAHARDGDTVGRLGGDEFVVLCEAVEDAAELTGVADRLAIEIARPIEAAGTTVRVGASCGIAIGSNDAERLLGEADAAMYRTKRQHQATVGATVG